MDKEQLELLEEFVDLCQIKPSILHRPELKFFKDWILGLGATIPEDKHASTSEAEESAVHEETSKEEMLSDESDLDISMEGVVDEDAVKDEHVMGDDGIEVSEEMQDSADDKRSEALRLFKDGNYSEAVKFFTEAILLNPGCGMSYAKRASCYVKMQCPNAAIKDANKSIDLNPDSAQAFKWRGLAYKLLGKWEEAFNDLTLSLKLDYADDTYEQMKNIEPKVKRIREHKRKYELKKQEKELNARRERVRKAQEANEKAAKENKSKSHSSGDKSSHHHEGFDDPFGGIGDLMNDPEMMEDLKDPEVMKILAEAMSNPLLLMQHASNPKIAKIIQKMQGRFGGGATGAPRSSPMDTTDPPPTFSDPKVHVSDDLD